MKPTVTKPVSKFCWRSWTVYNDKLLGLEETASLKPLFTKILTQLSPALVCTCKEQACQRQNKSKRNKSLTVTAWRATVTIGSPKKRWVTMQVPHPLPVFAIQREDVCISVCFSGSMYARTCAPLSPCVFCNMRKSLSDPRVWLRRKQVL